ncbi:hypothetical protein GPALN_004921 [Globodera pallida]|nr:hypothetical protein GPALN_004921 [Globodera pallida]
MTSALLRQCARSLLVAVVPLLFLGCCRAAEDDWDLRNFTCAKTGAKLRGGLIIPMDNLLLIDPTEVGYYTRIRVLVVNAKDENLTMMVVGAEPSCRRLVINNTKCRLSEERNVSREHQSKKCTADVGCKEFSFSCKTPFSKWSNRYDRIFIVEMQLIYRHFDGYPCNGSQLYIDDARLLKDPEDPPGERCPESTDTTTTQTTPTKKSATTTTSNSTTTSTGNTVTMESTDTDITMDWTLIIILAVVGASLLTAVVGIVALVLCRRKRTSYDVTE